MGVLDDTTKNLPNSVGVYLMKDNNGRAIYIGKAKNLRARVRSYFQKSGAHQRPQVPFIIQDFHKVEYLVTASEHEALILENALIKKHKPKYNILLKDDKTYSSLRLDPKEKFPRLTYTRRPKNDGAVYFGPFSSAGSLKQTKRLIHRIFPLRDCTDAKFKRHTSRPCLSYFMKLCLGPCAGKVNEDVYSETVDQAKMFLKGKIKEILKLLRRNMKRSSQEMRYELAANYRDQIRLLEKSLEVETLIAGSFRDKDIFGYHRENRSVEFEVLFSRGGTIVDKAEYSFKNVHLDDAEIVREFIGQFYSVDRYVPKEILLPMKIEDTGLLKEWLSEKRGDKVGILNPKRGSKHKLMKLANNNAEESHRVKREDANKQLSVLRAIQRSLALQSPIRSIECYDISNIMGTLAVASMVRFEDGKPVKSKYRRYRIKSVDGPNDYAMMHEVLSRRANRAGEEGWELPDLIMVDGGKGQLNIALQVMKELGIEDKTNLASIAKARDEGDYDKIYKVGRKNPLPMRPGSKELHLLMQIRDEAHRFAISYHKNLRTKRALESELDAIVGIGEKRRKALLSHFGTVKGIAEANVEDIATIPGMNQIIAAKVKEALKY